MTTSLTSMDTDAAQAAAMDFSQLEAVVPNVTAELQNFCRLALANIKVYKPQISRLDEELESAGRETARIAGALREAEVERAAGNEELSSRMSVMESQIGKLEIVLGALPLWKEELVSRIETVARDSTTAVESLKARTANLEDGLKASVANIAMQMTSLTTAVQSGHEARLLMSENMHALEGEMRQFKAEHTKRLDELEVASKETAEGLAAAVQRVVEMGADMGMMRVSAEQAKAVANRHTDKLEQLNRGLTGLGMTVDAARIQADVMKAAIATLDAARTFAAARLEVVEQDGSMKALQAEVALLNNGHETMTVYMAENDIYKEHLDDKIVVLHGKCDVGPPSLWKAIQQIAQQEAAAALARTEMAAATRSIEMLQRSSEQAHSLLAQQQQLHLQLVDENTGFADKMARESSRVLHYTDERLEGLSRRYEVEGLRGEVGVLRKEVAASMVIRNEGGGPELLAIAAAGAGYAVEPVGNKDVVYTPRSTTGIQTPRTSLPATGKERTSGGIPPPSLSNAAMLETTAMTQRLAVKLQLMEASQHAESERSAALERHYQYMQITLEEMGGGAAVDLRKLKREVGRLSDVYQDVAKQAARSQYVTGFQVINLLDDRFNGKAFDMMLTAKVNSLSNAVGPTDLEALRREILDVRHQLAALASGRMERRAGNSQQQQPQQSTQGNSPRESFPAEVAAPLATDRLALHAKPVRVSSGSVGGVAVSADLVGRVAHIEEGLRTALMSASVKDSEAEALKRKVMDLKAEVIKLQLSSEGSIEMMVQHHIANSLLPEVMERNAGEVKRLGRQISAAATQAARKSDVKALQMAVAGLHLALDGGQASVSMMHQPLHGSGLGASPRGMTMSMSGVGHPPVAAAGGGGGPGSSSAVRDQLQQLLHVRVSTLESALHQLTRQVSAVADEVENGGNAGNDDDKPEGGWGSDDDGSEAQHAVATPMMSLARTASGVGGIPSLKKGLASLTGGSAVRNLQGVGGSSVSSSSAGGGVLRMASGAAMNRQRARGGRKAAAAAAAMAEVQSRCAALERLCSEITSLPLPPAASPGHKETSEPDPGAASSPSLTLTPSPIPTSTASDTVTADEASLAVAAEDVHAKEEGGADSARAVAVDGEQGATVAPVAVAVAVAEGAVAVAADVVAAVAPPPLKSKWVPAPFGGTITTADLQRQVTELRLRLYQLDSSLPLLARSYEVALVAGQVDQSQGLWQWQWSGGSAPNANVSGTASSGAPVMVRAAQPQQTEASAGVGGGEGEVEDFGGDASDRTSPNEAGLAIAAGRGGSAGNARDVAFKLASLQAQLSIAEARGVSLEQAWADREAIWALAAHDIHTELPNLRETLAALLARAEHSDVSRIDHPHQSIAHHHATLSGKPSTPNTMSMSSSMSSRRPAMSDQNVRRPPPSRPAMSVPSISIHPLAASAGAAAAQGSALSPTSVNPSPGSASSPAPLPPLRVPIPSPRLAPGSPAQPAAPATPAGHTPSPLPPLALPLHSALPLQQQYGSGGAYPPPLSPPRVVPFTTNLTPAHMLDKTDIEVGGMTHDVVHALHAELRRLRHGPLPDGTCDGIHTVESMAEREEALQRLSKLPHEVQLHVELLEGVKLHLDRLMRSSADSPVDLLALGLVLMDMKVQLMEDGMAVMRAKALVTEKALETIFAELVSLKGGLQAKGSAAAITQVEVMLRDMGKEMMAAAEAGRDVVLAGRKLGGGEFWRCISCDSKATITGGPDQIPTPGGTNTTNSPRVSGVPRVTGPGVSTHMQRQSIGSRQGTRAQTSPNTASTLLSPTNSGASPASEWFKAGVGEFNDAGEAPVVRPATGQQSARNQMPRQSSPPQSGVLVGSRMAGFSSNHSLPPQNFHKEKRDLLGEQLAELERREGWAEGGVAALMLHMPIASEGGVGGLAGHSPSMPCSPAGLSQQQHFGAGNGSSSARQAANTQAAANAVRAPPVSSRSQPSGGGIPPRANARSGLSGSRGGSGTVDPVLSLVPVPVDQYHHAPTTEMHVSAGGAGLPSIGTIVGGKSSVVGGVASRTTAVR